MNDERLESLKKSSIGHCLIKAARLYNEKMISRFRDSVGLPDLQLYHLSLFAYIDISGSTINEISKRAGISKQAVSKTVSELVAMKVLLQEVNPLDARSKLISFPKEGPYTLEKGVAFLKQQDDLMASMLGKTKLKEFHHSLAVLINALDPPL